MIVKLYYKLVVYKLEHCEIYFNKDLLHSGSHIRLMFICLWNTEYSVYTNRLYAHEVYKVLLFNDKLLAQLQLKLSVFPEDFGYHI